MENISRGNLRGKQSDRSKMLERRQSKKNSNIPSLRKRMVIKEYALVNGSRDTQIHYKILAIISEHPRSKLADRVAGVQSYRVAKSSRPRLPHDNYEYVINMRTK